MPDDVAPDAWIHVHAELAGWAHLAVDRQLVVRRWHGGQLARGPAGHGIWIATLERLDLEDPALEAVRSRQLARALLRRAIDRLAAGDSQGARADLHAAARADPAAWRRPRQLLQAAARLGPLARIAARAWLASPPVRRRRELPPGA
jgi:hypothetical protein